MNVNEVEERRHIGRVERDQWSFLKARVVEVAGEAHFDLRVFRHDAHAKQVAGEGFNLPLDKLPGLAALVAEAVRRGGTLAESGDNAPPGTAKGVGHADPTKGELLRHYAEKEPHQYYQLDAFVQQFGDTATPADADGDCLFRVNSWELRSGGPAVRVQILQGTSKDDAVRVLRKLLAWLKQDGFGPHAAESGTKGKAHHSTATPTLKPASVRRPVPALDAIVREAGAVPVPAAVERLGEPDLATLARLCIVLSRRAGGGGFPLSGNTAGKLLSRAGVPTTSLRALKLLSRLTEYGFLTVEAKGTWGWNGTPTLWRIAGEGAAAVAPENAKE